MWAKADGRMDETREWYEQAREQFEYQLAADPDVSMVYYNASLLYQELGDRKRVEELLRKAVQYPPPLANAHVNLGNIFGNRGQYDAAEAHYLRALSIEQDHPQAQANLDEVRRMRKAARGG